MADDQNLGVPKRFATTVLPWVVGAGGLLVYLLTLNHWIGLHSITVVARVSGWVWQPALTQPLTWAVLYPFGWLPQAWIPLALNLFTAVCGGLVLVLLARSVALLPHDVTRDDPLRLPSEISILSTRTAWIPPVLAAVLCGLQLTFWEHATAVTGAMIDLLLFAYIIRCLLEFRLDQNERWLARCACVYGAGMANDWAIIAFLPVFIAALVRITGFGVIYNRRLLRRTALWGLAGLSLYLLLPVVHSLSSQESVGFWAALKGNLQLQKHALTFFRRPRFQVLALASLLPLVILSIRWRSHTVRYGDDTPLAVLLTKVTVRFVHALCLVAALWISLDPAFSPRHLDLGPPMLTYYYLSAMVAGYCAGYFLQWAASAAQTEREKPPAPADGFPVSDPQAADRRLGKLAGGSVWVVLGLLPIALLWRNLGQVRTTNGPAVHEFARQLCADLPAGRSVVLSEDPRQLVLLRAELGGSSARKDPLPLETRSLFSVPYQRFMAEEFVARWPVALPTNAVVRPAAMVRLVSAFAALGKVVYAHPSSGLFFERFVDQPNGLMHDLVRRGPQGPLRPVLPEAVVEANERLWQRRWSGMLETLASEAEAKPHCGPEWAWPLLAGLRLEAERNETAADLGAIYSKSLNYWGVLMQRLGHWAEAGVWFDRAVALNPGNLTAHINATYNHQRQQGDEQRLDATIVDKQLRELFDRYHNWAEILDANGPVDEPTYLLRAAQVLLEGGDRHQAAGEFARSAELAPAWAEPKLWLALSYIELRNFTGALQITERVETSDPPRDPAGLAQLVMCRTTALQGLGRTNEAAACLDTFIRQYRQRADVLSTAADLLERNRQYRKGLAILGELLRRDPNDTTLLASKGRCELHLGQFDAAGETLTRVISREPSNAEARLRRALAFSAAGKLEAARADFQELLQREAYAQKARLGLAALARRRQDTNAAIELYQEYLSNSIPGTRQYRDAAQSLGRLEAR